jgi:hypothetical protein
MSKLAIHPRHGRVAHKTDGYAFFGEAKFALHALREPGQRSHGQWYAALAI